MKKLYAMLLCCVIALAAMSAQAQNPVKWTCNVQMSSKTEGTVVLTATIDAGWHIYGVKPVEDGPIPTKIKYTGVGVSYDSKTYSKPGATTHDDPVYGCQVSYWENKVTFTRKFTITDAAKAKVGVSISYMCCNDMNCRPPVTETFEPEIP